MLSCYPVVAKIIPISVPSANTQRYRRTPVSVSRTVFESRNPKFNNFDGHSNLSVLEYKSPIVDQAGLKEVLDLAITAIPAYDSLELSSDRLWAGLISNQAMARELYSTLVKNRETNPDLFARGLVLKSTRNAVPIKISLEALQNGSAISILKKAEGIPTLQFMGDFGLQDFNRQWLSEQRYLETYQFDTLPKDTEHLMTALSLFTPSKSLAGKKKELIVYINASKNKFAPDFNLNQAQAKSLKAIMEEKGILYIIYGSPELSCFTHNDEKRSKAHPYNYILNVDSLFRNDD